MYTNKKVKVRHQYNLTKSILYFVLFTSNRDYTVKVG